MLQRLMVRLLAGKDAQVQGVSADTMLGAIDRKLDGFPTLVRPLPESPPRTPFDGPNGENMSPARSFSAGQAIKMLPDAFPLIAGMYRGSRMYDEPFVPTREEASAEFIQELEAMAFAAGAKDIAYIKVPRNAIFQGKGIPHAYAIVFTVEMEREPIETAPSFECMHEVGKGYKNLAGVGNRLAQHMRKSGFAAYPGTALGGVTDYVHLAEVAGLGVVGYHGLLITPGEGARVRINTIYTNISNLPLANERENEHRWIRDFCAMCRRCVRKCPVDAINPQPEARGDGGMQCIDHDSCRTYFAENYGCAVCLSECPFSHTGYEALRARFKGNPSAPQFDIPVEAVVLRERER